MGSIGKLHGQWISGEWIGGTGGKAWGAMADPMGYLLGSTLFQPKTTGSIVRKIVNKVAGEAGMLEANWLERGGRHGWRTSGLERFATDADRERMRGVGFSDDVLRNQGSSLETLSPKTYAQVAPGLANARGASGALGIGMVVGEGSQKVALNAFNTLQNGIAALGVTSQEAERQLLKFAQAAGITLEGGLDALTQQLIEGEYSRETGIAAIIDLTELFTSDLPEGIDIATIALRNMTETVNGEAVFNVANYTKELERLGQVVGGVMGATGNVLSGVGTAAAQGDTKFDPKQTLLQGVANTTIGGATSAVMAVLNESPEMGALSSSIHALSEATAAGGDITSFLDAVNTDSAALLNVLKQYIPALQEIGENFADAFEEAARGTDTARNAMLAYLGALNIMNKQEAEAFRQQENDRDRGEFLDDAMRKKRVESLDAAIEQAKTFHDDVRRAELEMERSAIIVAGLAKAQAEEVLSPQAAFLQSIKDGIAQAVLDGFVDAFVKGEAVQAIMGPIFDKIAKFDWTNATEAEQASFWAQFDKDVAGAMPRLNAVTGAIDTGVGHLLNSGVLGTLDYEVGNPPKTMAAGGLVTQPTFALIGEAGPELVVPLSNLSAFKSGGGNGVSQALAALGDPAFGGGGLTIQQIFQGNTLMSDTDMDRFARKVQRSTLEAIKMQQRGMGQ